MTREEPCLETLWLQNTRTMDKVQIIDRSNAAPSSKTFRPESLLPGSYLIFPVTVKTLLPGERGLSRCSFSSLLASRGISQYMPLFWGKWERYGDSGRAQVTCVWRRVEQKRLTTRMCVYAFFKLTSWQLRPVHISRRPILITPKHPSSKWLRCFLLSHDSLKVSDNGWFLIPVLCPARPSSVTFGSLHTTFRGFFLLPSSGD
jgi:hypothetical protein